MHSPAVAMPLTYATQPPGLSLITRSREVLPAGRGTKVPVPTDVAVPNASGPSAAPASTVVPTSSAASSSHTTAYLPFRDYTSSSTGVRVDPAGLRTEEAPFEFRLGSPTGADSWVGPRQAATAGGKGVVPGALASADTALPGWLGGGDAGAGAGGAVNEGANTKAQAIAAAAGAGVDTASPDGYDPSQVEDMLRRCRELTPLVSACVCVCLCLRVCGHVCVCVPVRVLVHV